MKYIFSIFLFLNIMCGHEDDKSETSTDDLNGVWVSGCITDSTGASITKYTIQSTDITSEIKWFSDNECINERLHNTIIGNFIVGENASEIEGAKNIDTTATSIIVTPKSEEQVVTLNSISFCKKNSWIVDETLETTPDNCGFESFQLDIYKISNNNLQFGNTKEIEDTATTRPSVLSEQIYTKE